MVQLADTFAKPMMCLLADLNQWFRQSGLDFVPEAVYNDVNVSHNVLYSIFESLYNNTFYYHHHLDGSVTSPSIFSPGCCYQSFGAFGQLVKRRPQKNVGEISEKQKNCLLNHQQVII